MPQHYSNAPPPVSTGPVDTSAIYMKSHFSSHFDPDDGGSMCLQNVWGNTHIHKAKRHNRAKIILEVYLLYKIVPLVMKSNDVIT
jgi:hypothetical protein